MSFANFPLLWLFGGRNNIFLWATGWSFASFNIFHRHVARVATVQAIVHSVLYVVMFIQSKYGRSIENLIPNAGWKTYSLFKLQREKLGEVFRRPMFCGVFW
jgi:hypothetical protein